jgi:hypothetical protein
MAVLNHLHCRWFRTLKGRGNEATVATIQKRELKEGRNGTNPVSKAVRHGPVVMALCWRKEKGGGAWVGQLGPKGQAKQADSKEKEHGRQGGCGPKCKRAAETIFDFKQGFWIPNQRVQILLN